MTGFNLHEFADVWVHVSPQAVDGKRDLLDRLRRIGREDGFSEGDATTGTPHSARLVELPLENGTLIGIVENGALRHFGGGAGTLSRRLARAGLNTFSVYAPAEDHWSEYRDGVQTVDLSHGPHGTFYGHEWSEIEFASDQVPTTESQTAAFRWGDSFGEESLDFLRDGDVEAFIANELGHRMGRQIGPIETIANFQRRAIVLSGLSADLIRDAIARARDTGSAELRGVMTISRRRLVSGGTKLMAYLSPSFTQRWLNPSEKSEADEVIESEPVATRMEIAPVLIEELLKNLQSLQSDSRQDALVAGQLIFYALDFEGYESQNPRTGQTMTVPPRKTLSCHLFDN